MSTDAGQGGQQQPQQLSPPEWYSKPPEWMTRLPTSYAPPPPANTSGGNADLVTAVQAMPERVVNALTDAIQGATQRAAGQGQQGSQGQSQGQQQATLQPASAPEQQPAGKPSFRDWFLGDGTVGSGGTW